MNGLDEYRRAGLDVDVDIVLTASQRWRDDPTTQHVLALREAIDSLARAYVRFEEVVEKFKGVDGTPAEITHGNIVKGKP